MSGAAPQSFVEAVRGAATAAVAAASIDVECGAEKVREAVALGEDILWEEALGDTREERSEEMGLVKGGVEIDDLWSEALASLCSGLKAPPDDLRSARGGSVAERLRGIGSRGMSWSKGSWRAPGRLERGSSNDVMLSKSGLETEITERSSSGEGGMRRLDGDKGEKELTTEEAVILTGSLEEGGEQRQQMSTVSGNIGDSNGRGKKETIRSEYAMVNDGVLKPVGGNGPDEAENPSPYVGESVLEVLSEEQAVSPLGWRSIGGECGNEDKGLEVDGRKLELDKGEAWERQGGEEQQGCEEDQEWVVKMQELHPRYPYCLDQTRLW